MPVTTHIIRISVQVCIEIALKDKNRVEETRGGADQVCGSKRGLRCGSGFIQYYWRRMRRLIFVPEGLPAVSYRSSMMIPLPGAFSL